MNNEEEELGQDIASLVIEGLQSYLQQLMGMQPHLKGFKPLRISCKNLHYRIILHRLGIDLYELDKSGQNKPLFTKIGKECYSYFQTLQKQETIEWKIKDEVYALRITRKFQDHDNIILEFAPFKETQK